MLELAGEMSAWDVETIAGQDTIHAFESTSRREI